MCSARQTRAYSRRLLKGFIFQRRWKVDVYRLTSDTKNWWIALIYRRDYVNSRRRADWLRVGPINKQIFVTNRSVSQWELSEPWGAESFLYSDAQYSAPDATLQLTWFLCNVLRTAVTATPGVIANSAAWRKERHVTSAWDANYNLTMFKTTQGIKKASF